MHEDDLSRLKATVVEQSLPRGQARDRQARATDWYRDGTLAEYAAVGFSAPGVGLLPS